MLRTYYACLGYINILHAILLLFETMKSSYKNESVEFEFSEEASLFLVHKNNIAKYGSEEKMSQTCSTMERKVQY